MKIIKRLPDKNVKQTKDVINVPLFGKGKEPHKEDKSIEKANRGYVVLTKRVAMRLKAECGIDGEAAKRLELTGLTYTNLGDREQSEYWEISAAYDVEWQKSGPEKRVELEWRMHHWGRYMEDGFSPKEADERATKINYEFWVGMKSDTRKPVIEAGSLEHVFSNPNMYDWKGMQAERMYVTKVQEANTEVLNLLEKESIALERVVEDWIIHRVFRGVTNPELTWRPRTLLEGMTFALKYEPDIAVNVGNFIETAYARVAEERTMTYLYENLRK